MYINDSLVEVHLYGDGVPRDKRPRNAKTTFCRFMRKGSCRSGKNCIFAHTEEEQAAAWVEEKKFQEEQKQKEGLEETWEPPSKMAKVAPAKEEEKELIPVPALMKAPGLVIAPPKMI